MSERLARNPSEVLQSSLTIINNQSFRDPKDEINIMSDHKRITNELIVNSEWEEFRRARFNGHRGFTGFEDKEAQEEVVSTQAQAIEKRELAVK